MTGRHPWPPPSRPTKKLMIVPWLGPLPEWTSKWVASAEAVGHGWEFLLDTSLQSIERRTRALGFELPAQSTWTDPRKLCDLRPAFGEMYSDEIEQGGYEFWGHTDLDCKYGPLQDYVTDRLLSGIDVYSNDPHPYLCGPFSLYRAATASQVFRSIMGWREMMASPDYFVLDEVIAAHAFQLSGLAVEHQHHEGPDSMYVHFNATKTWPE